MGRIFNRALLDNLTSSNLISPAAIVTLNPVLALCTITMALVNYDNSDNELSDSAEESTDDIVTETGVDKVEPEYKMRMPKSAARTANPATVVPALVTSKTKTGKVLLSVPALQELDSSSDESDNDRGAVTKQLGSAGQRSVGLLSLLPPTRAPVTRDGPKPLMMVPHQLAVKRPAPGHLVKRNQLGGAVGQAATQNGVSEDSRDSDVDDNDDADETEDSTSTSFFSFFQPAPESEQAVAEVRAATATSIIRAMASKADEPTGSDDTRQPGFEEQMIISSTSKQTPSKPIVQTPTSSLCRIDPAVLSELDVPKKEVPPDGDEAIGDVQCWTEHTFVPGPERKRARLNQPGTRSIPVHDLLATSNQSIREVNQADLTVGADLELMKSVTADESQYRSHRASEDDDPGKLAHRKHQITWLAYQASFFSSSCFAS
ncbi:hypothetical protein T265_07949 [Opisthorchis viverrini]|uniref:Uncharacterized protein n=1 Tax=Opisthorchis viverrini TaxID=6198 RepID=A0A074ZB92_OPIVI|nr:hypothetical protein T265_07949 [Opisthorchis viverrini]KER24393.1 hypothetical protein T265_07949 [Opisthorchis viverrini]